MNLAVGILLLLQLVVLQLAASACVNHNVQRKGKTKLAAKVACPALERKRGVEEKIDFDGSGCRQKGSWRPKARSLCMLRPSLQPAGPPTQVGNARSPREQQLRIEWPAAFTKPLQYSARQYLLEQSLPAGNTMEAPLEWYVGSIGINTQAGVSKWALCSASRWHFDLLLAVISTFAITAATTAATTSTKWLSQSLCLD